LNGLHGEEEVTQNSIASMETFVNADNYDKHEKKPYFTNNYMSVRNEKVIEEYIFNREHNKSLASSITPEQGIQLGLRLSTRNQ
jgi:hypothetical protein